MKKTILVLFIFICLFSSSLFASSLASREDVKEFIDEMVSEHKMNKKSLQILFNKTKIRQDIIDLMNRPAEKVKPWYEYKKIFLTDSRVNKGLTFWKENKEVLAYAKKVYGVPEEIIVAIIGVETFYGRITGRHRVIDALSTLAFDYPKRARFFRNELKQYLILCKEQKIDPLSKKGSYAGAMGYGQFMPSSYQHYAVNFDGKGIKDIWNNTRDAIGSVANYFKQHGWLLEQPVVVAAILDAKKNKNTPDYNNRKIKPKITLKTFAAKGINSNLSSQSPDMKAALFMLEEKTGPTYWLSLNNFYVISRYNHSHMYSMVVNLLSQKLKAAYTKKAI
ncbi:MAG: lytic murein transglycosylase B [Pseudomonadota bacterium]